MSERLYVVTDVETHGMAPPLHSMIQLGSVVVDRAGNLTGQAFEANLYPLPGETPLPSTMAWWAERPEVYAEVTRGQEEPVVVMGRYLAWLKSLGSGIVFAGYPVTFDYSFVNYYLWRFCGENPFAHGGLDMATMAADLLNVAYMDARKKNWPKEWFPPEGIHAHTALADAREQAHELGAMIRVRNARLAGV